MFSNRGSEAYLAQSQTAATASRCRPPPRRRALLIATGSSPFNAACEWATSSEKRHASEHSSNCRVLLSAQAAAFRLSESRGVKACKPSLTSGRTVCRGNGATSLSQFSSRTCIKLFTGLPSRRRKAPNAYMQRNLFCCASLLESSWQSGYETFFKTIES